MGACCTFVFKQSKNQAVALYSHWGEDTMYEDLAAALQHAAPRKGDESYYTAWLLVICCKIAFWMRLDMAYMPATQTT